MEAEARSATHSIRARLTVVACIAFVLSMLVLGACSQHDATPPAAEDRFDPARLTWSPSTLREAAPCLVGWRTDADGGALVNLSSGSAEAPVIWRAPAELGSRQIYVMVVDPRGGGMVAELYSEGETGEPYQRVVLFTGDGTAVEMPIPEDREGVSAVAYCDAGVLAVAYHATLEEFQTTVGLVRPGEGWTTLELSGDVPEHQFVESITARPGSDMVGLVLKVPGGPSDRDDDLLVLARIEGTRLTVVTPPYYDDSLPGAQPLMTSDGVVFMRLWPIVDGSWTPTLMAVSWDGTSWTERELLPPGTVAAGPETGQAAAQEPSGAFWVRDAGSDAHGQSSRLNRLELGASQLDPTDVDLSEVGWFGWVEGE